MANVQIKRVYEPASKSDGYRVLIDRVWPRGVSKQKAQVDEWRKEIAPSSQLRKWFGHDPAKFSEFKKLYQKELNDNQSFQDTKKDWQSRSKVTLVYSAKDEEHNQAVVLQEEVAK